jgi:hypothetical protein
MLSAQIHLYRLSPALQPELLQQRLRAILDRAVTCLPERPEPVCEGMWLDPDSVNASESSVPPDAILCRKRHIGEDVFDVVDAEQHCLKDPTKCHVIGRGIARPEIIRVTTREGLQKKSNGVRTRNDEQLSRAEESGDEEKAEALRKQIFESVGGAMEHYVKAHGDTQPIEDSFKRWIFRSYWDEEKRSLAQEARHMLVSGEYVWYEYSKTELNDWAAPAIQYCRALEFEVRRRIYKHHPAPPKGAPPDPAAFKVGGAGWTLGSLGALYYNRNSPKGDFIHNWKLIRTLLNGAGCDYDEFIRQLKRLMDNDVIVYRNHLAHGEPIAQNVAKALRETIIGDGGQPGILCWLVEHLEPAS